VTLIKGELMTPPAANPQTAAEHPVKAYRRLKANQAYGRVGRYGNY